MHVKIMSVSHGVDQRTENMNLGELVVFFARVSNPDNQHNRDTSAKLLKYLEDHRHWSPFEMVHATLEITATRDITRQILRHRSFTFQEFSQRYADPTISLGFKKKEARMQDPTNRQNSIECDDNALATAWSDAQDHVLQTCVEAYKQALAAGIAKEQARAVLPEGLTMSRMYMAGSLRSWMHYVAVRTEGGVPKEHAQAARDVAEAFKDYFTLRVSSGR
jgi:thymidylate synthase (FAD)